MRPAGQNASLWQPHSPVEVWHVAFARHVEPATHAQNPPSVTHCDVAAHTALPPAEQSVRHHPFVVLQPSGLHTFADVLQLGTHTPVPAPPAVLHT